MRMRHTQAEMTRHFQPENLPSLQDDNDNIIQNPQFEDGLKSWTGRGCNIMLHSSLSDGKVVPLSGKFFASAENRTQNWNGIQQEITARVQRKMVYEAVATVRIFGPNITDSVVHATLWIQSSDLREQYIGFASIKATSSDWVQLKGKFLINGFPTKAVIFFEGPPPGTDILLNDLVIKHAAKALPATPPFIEKAAFGVNIIANSKLSDGTKGWFPFGNCTLIMETGSPCILPPMAQDSLGSFDTPSGLYIRVTNRTQTWMGPAQTITEKVKLYLTYQVSGWVRIGTSSTRPQKVNVTLGIDDQWVNGGVVEITDDQWHEIGGSFRIATQPLKVVCSVQGPDEGVDLMVAGLLVFPVDRKARFSYLKEQTDLIRKRNVILKLNASDSTSFQGDFITIRQKQNSFPLGSCITRTNMDNEDSINFFTKNFNWGVFGNELKWYCTEPQQGKYNYKDADELLSFCSSHNIHLRGHCIFWNVESMVQQWIRSLNKTEMMTAIQNRLDDLLIRYNGKFEHYDVNNEMLHGSFYEDHLGKDISARMFKIANQLDSNAALFVNDYNIEDGSDTKSSPEKYIQQILKLQQEGAPVGGIGIQGHINNPIGAIICNALNKLSILGLPIWFTEVDVVSSNEFIRADDLEVMLRELYGHPCVEGVILWGFWELFMFRENSHLVNGEGEVNEAGKRLIALKQEWLSGFEGVVDENGEFEFRGFCGSYEVEVWNDSMGKIVRSFEVEPGKDQLLVSIN